MLRAQLEDWREALLKAVSLGFPQMPLDLTYWAENGCLEEREIAADFGGLRPTEIPKESLLVEALDASNVAELELQVLIFPAYLYAWVEAMDVDVGYWRQLQGTLERFLWPHSITEVPGLRDRYNLVQRRTVARCIAFSLLDWFGRDRTEDAFLLENLKGSALPPSDEEVWTDLLLYWTSPGAITYLPGSMRRLGGAPPPSPMTPTETS